ncbi:glycoside hydrolase/deacetylase [Basidiobolus meristosporus CBS 931.73]|uniref:Glycoside hydrolase/deacetylase n=1 Tax=Basidiobolus meristosporus CBS 931.73 TaxID=1314790 RepID=A0A1Y1Z7G5_9FUNG|nr:glycoside hydrolase/deacetylase [Basidiobolus meristosporus CBS 931.73]|eukprot:ORY06193.1 glycoside hydrolase/deacetylase [Basidiobolus meristosporus CBS 931.73]
MVKSLLKCSLVALYLGIANAQDDGNGFVFKCDKPGDFALTFDDGPSEYTGDLLNILSEKGVKATFFVLGSRVAQGDIGHFLKQTYDAGHQIASHTYDHLDLSSLSVDKIRQQMLDTEAEIKKRTGVTPAMMRPPYGNCNDRCQSVMKDLGYTVVQWNVDSDDWKYMENPAQYDQLVTNILNKINPSDSSKDSWVSLQHDIHKFSVERTPKIIDSIKAKGYNFVTVAQCLSNRVAAYKNGVVPPVTPTISTSVSTPSPSVSSTTSTTTSVPVSSETSVSTLDSSVTSSTSPEPTSSTTNSTTTITSSISTTSTITSSASTESTIIIEPSHTSSSTSTLPSVEAQGSGSITSPMVTLTALVTVLGFFAKI